MRSTLVVILGVLLLFGRSLIGVHSFASDPETATGTVEFAEDICPDLSELPTEEQSRALVSIHCQIIDGADPNQEPESPSLIVALITDLILDLLVLR